MRAWEHRGFSYWARRKIGIWTLKANGIDPSQERQQIHEQLIAAVMASPGHPKVEQAAWAVAQWIDVAKDTYEGTADYGRANAAREKRDLRAAPSEN